jgi:osmotically-inducible protein OsmY
MVQSAALQIFPAHEPAGELVHHVPAAPLPVESQQDPRLAQRIEHALRASGYWPLRGIEVTVHEHLVILAGRVPSYYLKQIAQETALSASGVDQVRNDLEVGRPT